MLTNGQVHGFFHTTRGVKKGDPLSPALFIITAEVLSKALSDLFLNKEFKSFGMLKWSDSISHLSNADDTIIFCTAEKGILQIVMNTLNEYEK